MNLLLITSLLQLLQYSFPLARYPNILLLPLYYPYILFFIIHSPPFTTHQQPQQSVRNSKVLATCWRGEIHKLVPGNCQPKQALDIPTWNPLKKTLIQSSVGAQSHLGSSTCPQRNSSFGAILRSVKLHLVVIYANLACFNFSPSASSRFRLFKTLGEIWERDEEGGEGRQVLFNART